MTRKVRTLGLALFAVCAMSALTASAACAQTSFVANGGAGTTTTFTVETDPQAPVQLLTTDVGAIECSEFHAERLNNATSTPNELTLGSVEYTDCSLGGLPANVSFGICDYEIDAEGSLILAGACVVTIEVSFIDCTITIPSGQFFSGALTYTNVQTWGRSMEITSHVDVDEEITYSWKGSQCPVSTSGSDDNGSLEGTLTSRAFQDSSQVNLTVN